MHRRLLVGIGVALLLLVPVVASWAINIQLDYSYDTNNFFAPGSQARKTMVAVADFYSQILADTFSSISTPPTFTSSLPSGSSVSWSWTMTFDNPSAAGLESLTNQSIEADEFRLFVGAKSLPGTTVGQGGPGGFAWASTVDPPSGSQFTQSEISQINAITNQFSNAVTTRGETSGFAAWGGAVSFDTDASANWHLDHISLPPTGKNDLFSVALHEVGHALGLGSSTAWNALAIGSGSTASFIGSASIAEFGGSVPLAFNNVGGSPVADKAHWRNGIMSNVFGGSASQEALMDPSINSGTRKRLTNLDVAALTDIGWSVLAPPNLPGDFNGSGTVDAADYTVWRNGLGSIFNAGHFDIWKANFGLSLGSGSGSASAASVPEPASLILAFATFSLALTIWTRRKV